MNGGNFTYKAQQALMNAQSIAQQKGQQQIDALHLLLALLNQEESIVLTLLRKLGADIDDLKRLPRPSLLVSFILLKIWLRFLIEQDRKQPR